MGRPPKVPEPPAVDPWDQTPEEERLQKVLAALQGEGKVKVSRRDEKGNLRYVGTLPLTDDFSEETVHEAFGGGRYSLRFFLTQDNDSYATHMGMEIEGPARERPVTPPAPAVPGTPGSGATFGAATEYAALQIQVARLTGLVEGLTAAMKESGGVGGGSLAAIKDVAEVVRSLMPASPTPAANQDVFGIAREAIAFGREVGKGGGGGDGFPWEKVVDQGVLPLVDMARKQAGTPAPAPGAPAATLPAATPGGPSMDGVPAWARYILAEQGFILGAARDDMNPETVAALLAERWHKKMPAPEWEAFGDAVAEDGFADQAAALAVQYLPGAAAVRPWLARFLAAVVDQLTEPEESGPTLALDTPPAPEDRPQ